MKVLVHVMVLLVRVYVMRMEFVFSIPQRNHVQCLMAHHVIHLQVPPVHVEVVNVSLPPVLQELPKLLHADLGGVLEQKLELVSLMELGVHGVLAVLQVIGVVMGHIVTIRGIRVVVLVSRNLIGVILMVFAKPLQVATVGCLMAHHVIHLQVPSVHVEVVNVSPPLPHALQIQNVILDKNVVMVNV